MFYFKYCFSLYYSKIYSDVLCCSWFFSPFLDLFIMKNIKPQKTQKQPSLPYILFRFLAVFCLLSTPIKNNKSTLDPLTRLKCFKLLSFRYLYYQLISWLACIISDLVNDSTMATTIINSSLPGIIYGYCIFL